MGLTTNSMSPGWPYLFAPIKPVSAYPITPATRLTTDTFGKVATGVIKPLQTESYQIPVDILANGQIVQKGLSGPQLLGQLDAQGNYALINHLRGNVFHGDHLTINGDCLKSENPFMRTLSHVELQRATNASEIPLLRQTLFSRGVNGQGIKIGLLDPKKRNQTGQWVTDPHTTLVASIINDPLWGAAPGAMVEDLGAESDYKSRLESDNWGAFSRGITSDYTRLFSDRASLIQNVLLKKDPSLRILNMTWGYNRHNTYMDIYRCLNALDNNGCYQFPVLRSTIFGPALYGSEGQKFQAVVNSIDNILDNNPSVQNAHRLYIDSTRQAAQNGLILVAATGNQNNKLPYNVKTKPGSALDEFSKSPYVINVAAANTNQQPGNRYGYTIANFSSRGDGYQWNPTITAPGAEYRIAHPVESVCDTLAVNGTSVAAPFVSGVIAMMLQRNPYLTFDQVRAKLQTTATPLQGYSTAEQGAGVINPQLAVLT
jgi:subtilisin family serine protease